MANNQRKSPITMSELVAVLAVIAVVIIAVIGGQSIFSPGALSAEASQNVTSLGGVSTHAELAGNCAACHPAPWSSGTIEQRCLHCHIDVALQFKNPHSVHSMAVLPDKTMTCTGGCHTDHGGSTATLTLVSGEHFSAKTSFSLKAHQTNTNKQPFVCMDCHPNSLERFDVNLCTTCHRQIDTTFMTAHLAGFGQACLKCHDGLDTYGKNFNHNLAPFPLDGKHATTACVKCHPDSGTIAALKAEPQDCNACHKADDTHKSALGTNCAQCHNATDWKQATLDHNQTAYPLTGKHVTVACALCHVNGVFKGTPKDCYSCHQSKDTHNRSFGTNCALCHNTTEWTQATINHTTQTAYPLTGAHITVACTSCHINSVYKGTPTDCYSCHQSKDTHNGSFGAHCAQCHNTTDWTQATINHTTQTSFPLTGKHITVACASCHVNGVYKGTPKDCYSCHKSDDTHNGSMGTNCASCHNTSNWTQATINHNLTAFPLTGRHTTVPCASCHINGVYKGTPADCYSCHKNDDRHRGRNGTNCGRCHSTSSWSRD